jgi:hypothetical protein
MENDKTVEQHLAMLAPPDSWEPDTAAALRRHHARRQEVWRRGPAFWWKLAMAAAVLIAVAVIPPTRGLAQRLWNLLKVGRVEVLRIDFDRLPDNSLRADFLVHPGDAVPLPTIDAVRARVGFIPRLPRPGALNGEPVFSVLGPIVYGTTLKLDDLRQLLQTAGIEGETLPPQWDGARLVVEIKGTVIAAWHDTTLTQSLPLTMAAPENFDLGAFTALVLRGLRVPRPEAERVAARMAANPALMMPVAMDENTGLRDVTLRNGPATMVYDYDENDTSRSKIQRLTLIWSASDRIYMLSSGELSDNLMIAVANSIE